eukprot:2483768-Pyramimonas_sp.AAC.1
MGRSKGEQQQHYLYIYLYIYIYLRPGVYDCYYDCNTAAARDVTRGDDQIGGIVSHNFSPRKMYFHILSRSRPEEGDLPDREVVHRAQDPLDPL